jgi:serine kinase of HPr protein (carbohydrate metabolism regulator)
MNQATATGAGSRLSAETVHASTVATDGRAVLIMGPSGSGKSDLTLRLLDRGFVLVSDDQTIVKRDGDRLVASPPPNIAGKLEIRGIGIVEMDALTDQPVALIVELTSEIQRLPDDNRERPILGVNLPLVSIDAMAASAPSKVALALDRLGLKF